MTQKKQAERNVRKPPAATPPPPSAAPETRRARVSTRMRLGAWRDHHLYGFFSSLGRLARAAVGDRADRADARFRARAAAACSISRSTMRARSRVAARERARSRVFLKPSIESPARARSRRAPRARRRRRRRDQDAGGGHGRVPPAVRASAKRSTSLNDNPLPNVLIVHAAGSDRRGLAAAASPSCARQARRSRAVRCGLAPPPLRRSSISASAWSRCSRRCSRSATLLVVGNTVRLDIQARREEIGGLQLIGASRGFVRRPFLYTGDLVRPVQRAPRASVVRDRAAGGAIAGQTSNRRLPPWLQLTVPLALRAGCSAPSGRRWLVHRRDASARAGPGAAVSGDGQSHGAQGHVRVSEGRDDGR